MKKILLLAISATIGSASTQAQTLFLKPGPAVGEDATITNTYGCTLAGHSIPAAGLTGGVGSEIQIADWTFNSMGCPHGTIRSLIRFTGLSQLPAGAVVTSASLKIYGLPSSSNAQGNSTYEQSPYPLTNEAWLRRVTSTWAENSVTWNTQPTTTTVNQIAIAATTARWNNIATLNVTTLVNDIVASGSNQGFEFLLQNEAYYRSQLYATSDHPDSTRWPELTVVYTMPNTPPCNLDFTYGSSTVSPYKYTFIPPAGTSAITTWSINGTPIYTNTSTPVTHSFNGPGSYRVCLKINSSQSECTKCVNICIADNGRKNPAVIRRNDTNFRSADPLLPKFGGIITDLNVLRIDNVMPNPTQTEWTASIISAAATNADVALYDFTGRLLQQFKVDLSEGKNSIQIEAQKLPANSYLLRVTAGANASVQATLIKR